MAKKTSEAKIRANRENAKKSTGPRTEEGKNRAKRNAVKHGLAGGGEIEPDDLAREMRKRADEWAALMKPAEGPEAWLVARAAALSARVDAAVGCALKRRNRLQDEAVTRNIAKAEAAKLGKLLESRRDVHEVVTRLESTVAGCDWMIDRWREMEARRREGNGAWSRDDLVLAMKLTGHSPRDLVGVHAMHELAKNYCAACDYRTRDNLMMHPLLFSRNVQKLDPNLHPDEGSDDYASVSVDEARERLGAFTAKQIKRLQARRAERTEIEASLPSPVNSIDLSEEGDRLRRYESSLDRQLHNAMRRISLLRSERMLDDEISDDEPLRNEASPNRLDAAKSVPPVQVNHPWADSGNGQMEPVPARPGRPEVIGETAANPAMPNAETRETPSRNEAKPDASSDFLASRKSLADRSEEALHFGRSWNSPRSVAARDLLPQGESREDAAQTRAPAPVAEIIRPRRTRVATNDQPVASVTSSTPPLRGRMPGKDESAAGGRGRYLSPEIQNNQTSTHRKTYPQGRLGFSSPGLILHGEERKPIVERPDERGGRGEPGGTRAMGACEPGQGGNAAAISIASMCPGAPPRLSQAPASYKLRPQTDGA